MRAWKPPRGLAGALCCLAVGAGLRFGAGEPARRDVAAALHGRVDPALPEGVAVVEITRDTFGASERLACCKDLPGARCRTTMDLRACHGLVFDRLAAAGAAVVGFDLDLTRPGGAADVSLAKSFRETLSRPALHPAELVLASAWREREALPSGTFATTCCTVAGAGPPEAGAEGGEGGDREVCLSAPDSLVIASAVPGPRFPRAGFADLLPAPGGDFLVLPSVGPCLETDADGGRSFVAEESAFSLAVAEVLRPRLLEETAGRGPLSLLGGPWPGSGARAPAALRYEDVASGAADLAGVEGHAVVVGGRFEGGEDEVGGPDRFGLHVQARAVATLLAGPDRWPRPAPLAADLAVLGAGALLAWLLFGLGGRPAVLGTSAALLAAGLVAGVWLFGAGLETALPEVVLGLLGGAAVEGWR